ncbi:hypothetical protein GCM10009660_00600 [Catellatospora bangladeshensis]
MAKDEPNDAQPASSAAAAAPAPGPTSNPARSAATTATTAAGRRTGLTPTEASGERIAERLFLMGYTVSTSTPVASDSGPKEPPSCPDVPPFTGPPDTVPADSRTRRPPRRLREWRALPVPAHLRDIRDDYPDGGAAAYMVRV